MILEIKQENGANFRSRNDASTGYFLARHMTDIISLVASDAFLHLLRMAGPGTRPWHQCRSICSNLVHAGRFGCAALPWSGIRANTNKRVHPDPWCEGLCRAAPIGNAGAGDQVVQGRGACLIYIQNKSVARSARSMRKSQHVPGPPALNQSCLRSGGRAAAGGLPAASHGGQARTAGWCGAAAGLAGRGAQLPRRPAPHGASPSSNGGACHGEGSGASPAKRAICT
jgi:hypothetical protein